MLTYRLVRSSRRTLALEISAEGELIARAPRRLPREAVDRFVASKEGWIKKHLAKPRCQLPEPSPEEAAKLKQEAKAVLPGLVAHFADLLQVKPSYVKITSARKRFGSCNTKGGLCFSWRLMRYPFSAVEYVVAHEVAHLIELNHSPAFYALLDDLMPDHRQRAQLLKTCAMEEKNANLSHP